MHTRPFHVVKKHRTLASAIAAIAIFLLFPIFVSTITHEEDTNDSHALPLWKDYAISFTVSNVPHTTDAIEVWTGDTTRAPKDARIVITLEDAQPREYILSRLKDGARGILIPIRAKTIASGALTVTIAAPDISEKSKIIIRTQQNDIHTPAYRLMEKRPLASVLISKIYIRKADADDIHYVWEEGLVVTHGENPYKKGTSSEYGSNKFATYFPLSYEVSALIQAAGFSSFEAWITIARHLIISSQLLSGIVVFIFLYNKKSPLLALFGFFIILFHRFTLYPLVVSHIDFPAILFVLVGFMLLEKRPKTSFFLIGISLAIKQMAIFVIPIVLMSVWHSSKSIKRIILCGAMLAVIPIVSFVPFFANSPQGTFNSIVFSTTRNATGDFSSQDISSFLNLHGLSARIIMGLMMLLLYAAFWKKEVRFYGACLGVFTIFAGFNPVLFSQYLAWIIPFIPLAIWENAAHKNHNGNARHKDSEA